MKRGVLVLILAAVCTVGWLPALDFGATIDNSTGYFQNSSTPFQQLDTLTLWFNTHMGKALTFDAQIHGALGNQAPIALADLDTLSLIGVFPAIPKGPSVFSFALGRFPLKDVTAEIYDQTIDGFQLGFTYPALSLTTTFGYTGLTINPSSSIIMTKADSIAHGSSSNFFGSPRIIGLADLTMPSLFLRQDLTVQALVQQDLRPVFDKNLVQPGTTTPSSSAGGSLNSQYFTAKLAGPVVSNLYYDTSFTLETGKTLSYITGTTGSSYQYENILAYYATLGARYYLPAILNSVAGIRASIASGDADYASLLEGNTAGDATAFQTITNNTVSTVLNPTLENIMVGELSYSLKPFSSSKNRFINSLQTEIKVLPFLRPTLGPVGASGVNPSSTDKYLGTEVDGAINYRPFSDLGASIQAGLFLPNKAAFVQSLQSPQLGGKLELSFSF